MNSELAAIQACFRVTTDDLSDFELAILNNFAQQGFDIRNNPEICEKTVHMFDAKGVDGRPVMHTHSLEALAVIVNQRLAK